MPTIIDNIELTPAPPPEKTASPQPPSVPPPTPAELTESALEQLEERHTRVWAH